MTRWGSTTGMEPEPGAQAALPVRSEVRLRMKARLDTPGVDGAWWPRSRDPAAVFPELVLVMSSWVGPVCRVTYRLDEWEAAGRELVIDGWPVELAGSVTLERNTVLVTGTHQRQRSLLVVPPGVRGGVARAVLRSAAGPEVVAGVEEMLTSNGVRRSLHSVDEMERR